MQSETERVLRNLSILSSVSQNDKLNTNEETFSIYIPTPMRGVLRMWYSEKRNSNVIKIQEAVRLAVNFIQNTLQEVNSDNESLFTTQNKQRQCKRMFETLSLSRNGLSNLQQTYKDDISMSAQLKIVSDEIDDFIHITTNNQTTGTSFLMCSSPTFQTNI